MTRVTLIRFRIYTTHKEKKELKIKLPNRGPKLQHTARETPRPGTSSDNSERPAFSQMDRYLVFYPDGRHRMLVNCSLITFPVEFLYI